MNKKGQGGLSMNTIVVAIVAIIVLLLIVTFFTGGLGEIREKITKTFENKIEDIEKQEAQEPIYVVCTASVDSFNFRCDWEDGSISIVPLYDYNKSVEELFKWCPTGKIKKSKHCIGERIEIPLDKYDK